MPIDFPNSPTNGQTHVVGSFTWQYDGEKWISANGITLDGLSNVTVPSPTSGDFLKWNGTAWVNDAIDLGTDTTGDYVSSLVAGTNISISNNSGEGATPTISVSGSVSGVDSISGIDFVQFDTTANTTPVTGLLGWDSVNGTLNLGLSANKHIHIGEESLFRVRNATGTTIGKGAALYASGVEPSGRIQVTPYVADGTISEVRFMGLASESIADGVNGFVQHFGHIRDLDTRGTSSTAISVGDETWAAGDILYVHPTVPGKLTNVAPRHAIVVALVIVRHQTTGWLFVRPSSGGHIEDIHDVVLTSPADGQFLRYNSASTVWVNDTINLGTDTAGDYVQSLVAGTGVTLTNNSGETATPTVAIGQSVATSASVTFAHLVVQGDMEVQGTITRLNETNLDIDEAFIYLNANSASANPDMGVAFNYNDGTYRHAGLFRDASDGIFKVFEGYEPEPQTPINTSDATYSDARFQADSIILTQTTGTAPMSVSSSTVVTNLNADKLDGQDGSYYAPIDSPTFTGTVSLPNNTVALGTQTTGNYMSDVAAGTGISVSHTPGEGSSATVSLNATLDDLSNVTATSPADGNFLKYVSASSSWVPATIPTINALDDIGNVTVPSPNTNDVLTYNGSVWTSASVSSGGSTVTASTTPPSSPSTGSIWFDSSSAKTYVYYDSFWVEIGGTSGGAKMYVDPTAPTSPLEGQLWFKSDTAQTFAYYDSFWVEVGAAGMSAIAADTAPASPVTGQLWFNSSTGGTYVYFDSSWIEIGAVAANTVFNIVDAKGDILVGTADNVLARQAVGTDGQLLQANSAETTGLQWFTPTYAPSASPTFTGTVVLPSTTSIGTVDSTEIGYLDGVTSAIQTQLNARATLSAPTFTGTVVLPSTTSIGTVDSTEISYLDGVTSAIQTQLNAKAPLSSPTFTGTVVLPATSAGGAINPSATNTYDLGTASLRWRNIYTQDLHLSNGIGDYTIIEGEENLYLVNHKTNKSFKFALIEVTSSEVPKASDI